MTSRERVSPMANSLRLSSKTPSLRRKMKPKRTWVSTWRQRLSKLNSQRSKRRLQVTSRLVVNLVLAKKEHRTHWKVLKTLLMISIKFNPRKIEKLRTKQSSSLFRGMLSLSADKHQQLVDHQDPPSPEKSELEEESNLEPPLPPTMISPTRTNLTDLKRRRKDKTSLDKRRQTSKTVVTLTRLRNTLPSRRLNNLMRMALRLSGEATIERLGDSRLKPELSKKKMMMMASRLSGTMTKSVEVPSLP